MSLPIITDSERERIESKLVSSCLSKINSGLSPTKTEMQAVEAAHARGKAQALQSAPPLSFSKITTELGFEVALSESLESRGLHDLTRLDEKKPELVKAAVKMLALGAGVDEIAGILSMDVRTIAAIRDRAETNGTMPGHKEMTVRRLKSLLGLMLGKYDEQLRSGKEVSAMDIGIIADKIELLSGGVTSRSEHVVTSAEEDEFATLMKQARAVQSQGMVIDAEELSAMPARPALGLPSVPPDPPSEMVTRDSKALDEASQPLKTQ